MKAKNIVSFGVFSLILVLPLTLLSFAATNEESITITTYYPSPYGVYKTLRLYPRPDISSGGDCFNKVGEMSYYQNPNPNPNDPSENGLYVCDDNSKWSRFFSSGEGLGKRLWSLSDPGDPDKKDIYNTDLGNVGIGTTTPGARMDIRVPQGPPWITPFNIGDQNKNFLRVYRNGDVGIGRSASYQGSALLSVMLPIGSSNDIFEVGKEIPNTNPPPPTTTQTYFSVDNDGKVYISRNLILYSGNVSIGAGISPTSRLDLQNTAAGYNQLRLRTSYTPTHSADLNGNTGDIAWDNDYLYVKTPAEWKRAEFSSSAW